MLLGVNERDVAVLGLVRVACGNHHAVERVQGVPAGMALHHAAWDVPVGVGEGKGDATCGFLHGVAAAIAAGAMLTVQRFSFIALTCENVLVTFEQLCRYCLVEQFEVHGNSHRLNVPAAA